MKRTLLLTACIFLLIGVANGQPRARTVSLIVAENHSSGGGAVDSASVVRYRFRNGELTSRDVVLTASTEKVRFDLGTNQLYQNRYVIDWAGDIIDLQKKKLLLDSRLKFYDAENNRIILVSENGFDDATFFVYDLKTEKLEVLKTPGKWALPGKLSPDGTKSVSWREEGGDELWLNTLDGKKLSLGDGFSGSGCGDLSCPPVFWLDNERILTTREIGDIVVLRLDGSVEPITNIYWEHSPYIPKYCRFYRDAEGKVIYDCDNRSSVIDAKNRTFSPYEWHSLGSGFYFSHDNTHPHYSLNVKHQNKTIDRLWGLVINAKAIEGYLAMSYGEIDSNPNYPDGIKVWSDVSGKWTTIEVDSLESIIGWVEETN